ncbi:MAG: GntR family transcriptional regulator [Clostridia bacterium]|nr:GntR family transcriptional regulator [Clostridia bacterium]
MRNPAYFVVYETIRSWIYSGKYKPGDLLPPEPELIQQFAVSRTTIRKALEMLSHEGLIVARQGIGTIVLDYHTTQSLNTVTSFTTTLREKGFDVTIKAAHAEVLSADLKISQFLGITTGSQIAMIYRVPCASGVPIAIIRNYIPYSYVTGIEKRVDQIQSLYAFLKNEYDLTVEATRDRIFCRSAEIEEAYMLDIQPKSPLLCVNRVCYQNSKPIAYDTLLIRGDMYEYELDLSVRI